MRRMQCDLFCAVVDNFGDAGVCWRLARQWVAEERLPMRLWVDDPVRLARIAPEVDPSRDVQQVRGVEVRRWSTPFPTVDPADVVIEAFACQLPASYEAAMAARPRPPVWINLEYLSAEDWVDGVHGLPSPHPSLPLVKHFFFPGFSARSGGLLAERGLADARTAFRDDPAAERALWVRLGVDMPGEAWRASLFSYDNPAAAGLFDAWSASPQPVICLVPHGTAPHALGANAGLGCVRRTGALQVWHVPFVPQDDYDRLLWACDFNFVRGEDSFLRAQYAARPMLWQIYPQADAAHWEKLRAWEGRYLHGCPPEAAAAWRQTLAAWNRCEPAAVREAWPEIAGALPALGRHAAGWTERLLGRNGLTESLVRFCRDKLK